MKRTTGHLAEKKGKWYAVINLYDTDGKRKEKWQSLDLEAKKGTKTEANHRLNQLLEKFNTGDLYLQDTMTRAERERNRIGDMLVEDYLAEWLASYKPNVTKATFHSYQMYVNIHMIPFFKPMKIKVKEITGDEINEYYSHLRLKGLKGTTCQRHHALLHLAFKSAMKRRIIPSNPVDQADRPKAQQFIGNYYNADEIKALLDCTKDDPLHIVIMIAAYYGLRRSEVIGLKWAAIDFGGKTISIKHKVLQDSDGLTGYDVMKTKSSYRTMPLMPIVEQALIAEREKQAEMKQVFGKSYNRKYEEYICVDALGELIKPNYVTDHFQVVLKNNGLRKIRFHDLRHSCASLMLANGVQMKLIQEWLGHSDIGTTSNVYSHVDSESKKLSAAAIEKALDMNDNETEEA
ncbi:site-specific integrase [Ruminococcus sp. YE78]|uniref:tyrosine-type recombinase/integrase n=1 Tax=Ruminococcus sp. YE78 TaxID=1352374 RepID=UPI00088F91D7|nr:site-specific integrase [Ruminococcus sp. YE78]SDA32491.1 Site-specific recombinase XerD [Ruminococcus sp. YE78]